MAKAPRDLAVLTIVAVVTAQSQVHGYIDPGSTSMLLQGVIGGVAAVLVITRSYWARTLDRLRRATGRAESANAVPKDGSGSLPNTTNPGA